MKAVLFLCVIYFAHKTSGLKCYTCSATEDDADTTCVDKPASVLGGITDCDKKYCTITRVDYKDPRGKLASMGRGCVDTPTYLNQVVEDETHRVYYRSCKTALCNSGSGKTETGSGDSGSFGDKSTIYCPGMGDSGSSALLISLVVTLLSLFFCQYLR